MLIKELASTVSKVTIKIISTFYLRKWIIQIKQPQTPFVHQLCEMLLCDAIYRTFFSRSIDEHVLGTKLSKFIDFITDRQQSLEVNKIKTKLKYYMILYCTVTMDLLSDFTLQKLEINYKKKLISFVNKLNQCTTTLKAHAANLKSIAMDLVVKSQQIEKLEHIE